MTQTQATPTIVVGRNVSGALLVEDLRQRNSSLPLSWVRSPSDTLSETNLWVLLPEKLCSALLPDALGIRLKDFHLFLNERRSSGGKLLTFNPSGKSLTELNPALLRRLLSLALASDTTPALWKKSWLGWEPDVSWPNTQPVSWPNLVNEKFRLVTRESFLTAMETRFKTQGIECFEATKRALSLEQHSSELPRLVLNAPYGTLDPQRVFWSASPTAAVHGEPKKIGRWKILQATVDPRLVTALPHFSVWVSSEDSQISLESGLWSSGLVKRVIVAPAASKQALVQIETLELEELNDPDFVTQEKFGKARVARDPASFLWGLCPKLKGSSFHEPAEFSEWELGIGRSPNSYFFSPAKGLVFCYRCAHEPVDTVLPQLQKFIS